MGKRVFCFFIFLVLAFGLSTPGYSRIQEEQFFEGGREGWFWYEEFLKEQKEKDKEKPQVKTDVKTEKAEPELKPEPVPEPERPFDGFVDIDWDAVWNLHPTEFQALIDETQNWAVQEPTVERVRIYVALQNVAKERAKKFQEAWGEALLQDPVLAHAERHPSHLGTVAGSKKERALRQQIIPEMRENMGIVYFYSDNCSYCEQQKPIMEYFLDRWNWENVAAINVQQSPETVAEYNVQIVPDIWVVGNIDGEVKKRRLAAGFANLAEIEKGMLNAYFRWHHDRPYEQPQVSERVMEFEDFLQDNMASDSLNQQKEFGEDLKQNNESLEDLIAD